VVTKKQVISDQSITNTVRTRGTLGIYIYTIEGGGAMVWAQIGARIEGLRSGHHMSKAQFAKAIGVSGQYIGMVEKGKCHLSVNLVEKICRSTGASADFILFGNIEPGGDQLTIAALSGLSNEQIEIALDIIKKIAALINTEGGNEALIREVAYQSGVSAHI